MPAPSALTDEQQRRAIAMIRGLAMDAPAHANSGHQGTAMALAPLAHVLYSRILRHSPAEPGWFDRDRLVLSNGHASILQYSMLYLSGYGIEIEDLRSFRSWGSSTPGHPEAGHTPGIEVTTGPLGQGFANAVGMAIAERILREQLGSDIVDHRTYAIVGDGCLMEGISHEAASLAGHLGLGRLICIFDDNRITIDGSTELSASDDVGRRFESYGWHVIEAGEIGEDCDALERVLLDAQGVEDRPTMIVLRTHIGFPSPDHTDSHEAHGLAFSAEDISRTKVVLGIPDEPFWVDTELVEAYRTDITRRNSEPLNHWHQRCSDNPGAKPDRSALDAALSGMEPDVAMGTRLATRQALQQVLDRTGANSPFLVSGSADLTSNTGVRLPNTSPQAADSPGGRQIYFGVREHAMGAIMVGIAHHGGLFPIGGTFFVFADYMRPAIRLAAMSGAPCCFVFTHDSVGVGEDGPTHQPIEHLASLRSIPDLEVIRPADANEVIAAWPVILDHAGPTALVLSRQAVEVVTDGSAVHWGAGEVYRSPSASDADSSDGRPSIILLATGSEVSLCVAAATSLESHGILCSVVSMPSWERFARQSETYRRSILPDGVPVLSVEAATTFGWERYADRSIGIDRFGASAPGAEVMERLGLSVENITAVALDLLNS